MGYINSAGCNARHGLVRVSSLRLCVVHRYLSRCETRRCCWTPPNPHASNRTPTPRRPRKKGVEEAEEQQRQRPQQDADEGELWFEVVPPPVSCFSSPSATLLPPASCRKGAASASLTQASSSPAFTHSSRPIHSYLIHLFFSSWAGALAAVWNLPPLLRSICSPSPSDSQLARAAIGLAVLPCTLPVPRFPA